MNHVLDNPIYHALTSADQMFAKGSANVMYYLESMAAFAGLKNNAKADFELLYQSSPDDCLFVVFSTLPLQIPKRWKQLSSFNMYQLVYKGLQAPVTKNPIFKELTAENIGEMKSLVELTKPGPFLSRTIDFGDYIGIFKNKQLVAMAGHRFNVKPYREISAVCTHPAYVGKGYASELVNEQISRILNRGEIPFLHVRKENEGAVHLYQKLGFEIRTLMMGYVIEKEDILTIK